MIINSLKEILNHIAPIKEEDWQAIAPILTSEKIRKDEFLLQENNVCKHITFIKKGAFRAYQLNDDLVEMNLLLKSSNEFITDYSSFITATPSRLCIQAIEDAEIIMLPKSGLTDLYNTSFYWNKFGRIVAESIYISSKNRAEELLFLTPEERYLKLIEEFPHYFQLYSLKHLASYLGITPQSLSRIRARLTHH